MTPDYPGAKAYLVMGQSNALADVGLYASGPDNSDVTEAQLLKVAAFSNAGNYWDRVDDANTGGPGGNNVGQWFAKFAQLAIANGDAPAVLYVGNGVSGQAIDYFLDGHASGNYDATIAKVTASGATIDGIIWWQGEADSGTSKAAHLADLETLRADWRTDIGEVPIYVIRGAAAFVTAVDEALDQFAADNDDVTAIDISDLTGHDGTHYAYTDGYEEVGVRVREALFA